MIAAVVAEPPIAFHRYVLPPEAVSVPDPQKVLGPDGVILAVMLDIAMEPVRGELISNNAHAPDPLYENIL